MDLKLFATKALAECSHLAQLVVQLEKYDDETILVLTELLQVSEALPPPFDALGALPEVQKALFIVEEVEHCAVLVKGFLQKVHPNLTTPPKQAT